MATKIGTQIELMNRLRWQVMFRSAFLLAMGVSAAVLSFFYGDPFSKSLGAILVGGLIFSSISWFSFPIVRERNLIAMAWVQITSDLALTTLLVAITGGVLSAFSILYALQVIVAALVLSVQGALFATSAGIISFLGFSLLESSSLTSSHIVRMVLVCSTVLLVGGSTAMLFRSKDELMESLKNLEKLYQAIVDYIPSGILYVDKNSRVVLMNPAAVTILGSHWMGQKLDGSELSVLLREDARLESIINLSAAEKVLGHHAKILPEGGKIIVFQDVTGIRDLEKKVILKDKLASVGQLAAGIAHEIRNPLASLSGSIQLLKSENSLTESSEKLMSIVLRETDRLDALLQSFLNYARPSVLNLSRIQLLDVFNDVVVLVENLPEFRERFIRLENQISKDLWCICDANQLKQILWNLLKNSVQASRSNGSIKVKAEQKATDLGQMISVEVEDNGEGIDEHLIERVFDPFFTTKSGGSGLGLPLVYQIVKAHGGRMGVRSKSKLGTTIWFEILQDASALGGKIRSESVSAA
jgi:two-component system sensor histidine kinase PilS (NtrC family)